MPYYLVPATADAATLPGLHDGPTLPEIYDADDQVIPVFGRFDSRIDAAKDQRKTPVKSKIVLIPTYAEYSNWREREAAKIRSGAYVQVPWAGEEWCRYSNVLPNHFAHMSIKFAGLVAYTPDAEHGLADRQLRTTPGRYLAKFVPDMELATVDMWIARVKAFDGTFKIARTADEIVSVYRAGPTSCMSHAAAEYDEECNGHHPVEVYGDSDLAVAYLGDVATGVTARTVIWTDKKRFTRLYGPTSPALRHALIEAGYVDTYKDTQATSAIKVRAADASFLGARIRRIELDRGWVLMPYIDGYHSADLDGTWLALRADTKGDVSTQQTGGRARMASECAECGRRFVGDGDTCDDCGDDSCECAQCGVRVADGDGFCVDLPRANGATICESCYEEYRVECVLCSENFYPRLQFSSSTRDSRRRSHMSEVCADCANDHTWCATHDRYFADNDGCEECAEDAETEAAEADEADDRAGIPPPDPPPAFDLTWPPFSGPVPANPWRAVPFVDLPADTGVAAVDMTTWREAIAHGRWVRPTSPQHCHVGSCRASLPIGTLTFQLPPRRGHAVYCAECAGDPTIWGGPARDAAWPIHVTRTRTNAYAPDCAYYACDVCYHWADTSVTPATAAVAVATEDHSS